jgi:GT2 family glycosyltransferase
MMRAVPDVSYAMILTRHAERAAVAVRSIAQQTPDGELLLVLNDADNEMRAFAQTLELDGAGGTRVLHDGSDIGVVSGWNLALREARAAHVCVVHEDAELRPGCAARLLKTLRERPEAGSVSPRVLLPDGSAKDGAIIWSDAAGSRLEAASDTSVRAVDYSGSSCLMLSREAALGVGGFDQRFFPAIYVDVSLGVALWQAGRVCLCDPRAVHFHNTAAMVDEARGPRRSTRFRHFLVERNRARFRDVFSDWLAEQADRCDAHDASRVLRAEQEDAQARTRAREQRALAAPLVPLPDRLTLDGDPEATALLLRRALEDEFMAELIEREQALAGEAADLHRGYAELHVERDRMHRRYAELHAELDRVHAEYAALWDDRERLREIAAPLLAKEEHA